MDIKPNQEGKGGTLPGCPPVIGLVTIGQSPRVDVVPEMTAVMGPGVDVREAGALDGLSRAEIAALAPTGDDEILVTRLAAGSSVFLGKQKINRTIDLSDDGQSFTFQGRATIYDANGNVLASVPVSGSGQRLEVEAQS